MAAFGQLERLLLRAAGARLTLRSVLATAYNANAIAVAVPVVGSAIAAAYAFRDFRRGGADAGQASIALAVAGVFSAVAFAVIAAFGVALTGNPAAAALALAGGVVGAALVAVLLVSVRHDRARARLVALADWAVRGVRRVTGRPRRDVARLFGVALERAGSLRLGYGAVALAFGCALVNWLADVCCLVCAMFALGVPVPWARILVAWTAASGAASFSPVPGGIGVVEVVLTPRRLLRSTSHPARSLPSAESSANRWTTTATGSENALLDVFPPHTNHRRTADLLAVRHARTSKPPAETVHVHGSGVWGNRY